MAICVLTPHKFIRIPENRMYGAETIKGKGADVNISSKERTLIDLLYFNKPVGGITSAVEIFTEIVKNKQCDIKKLIEYAARFPNITIRKRIGLVISQQ